jgi:four helix bundle protein
VDDNSYRKLDAWKKAMDAYDAIYKLSGGFPPDERFGLTSQIRRAALSIASNIAEGYGRKHRREYVHHLYMARGSMFETETQLIAAVRNQMCSRPAASPAWEELQHAGRLLNGLIASLDPET